jgi:hypothetical protein
MPDKIDITPMRNSTVGYLYGRRSEIQMDPTYQRQGAVWSVEKQQLLIDSLINGFDVPKIYFHQFLTPRDNGVGGLYRYALVDGKQRLEAVFDFIDGGFPLSDDFKYIDDTSVKAKGLTFNELTNKYPNLVALFNSTVLDVVAIRTEDLELIEEMFSRLNEAVPLNAAEKRNAFGGPCPPAVREMIKDPFFVAKLPFKNTRYRHFDLAAKFLYWSDQRLNPQKSRASALGHEYAHVRDVKKYRLDSFFREMKAAPKGKARVAADLAGTEEVLKALQKTFVDDDPLLSSIGMISLYFLLFQHRLDGGEDLPSRESLGAFDAARRIRQSSDEDLPPGAFQLLEFSRLAQSPNDGSALAYRLAVLDTWLSATEAGEDAGQALADALPTIDE